MNPLIEEITNSKTPTVWVIGMIEIIKNKFDNTFVIYKKEKEAREYFDKLIDIARNDKKGKVIFEHRNNENHYSCELSNGNQFEYRLHKKPIN